MSMEVNNNDHEIAEDKKKKKKKKRKTLDVKMEVFQEKQDKVSPLVGYFPSGYNPHNVEDGDDTPQVKLFRKRDRPNRIQLVVSPKDCKVDFVGSSHSGEAAASQVCTYALGVLDKNTQSLKIIPIAANRIVESVFLLDYEAYDAVPEDSPTTTMMISAGEDSCSKISKILRLEPVIGGLDVQDKDQERLTEEQKADGARTLNTVYGSKKQVTRENKREVMKQKMNPSNLKELETKIEGVEINKEALVSAVADPARNIPPYNISATTSEEAYPLDHIILTGEWDFLLDILELVQAGTEVAPNVYPSFVYNRMQKLLEIEDEFEQKKVACILSYLNHLIKFKDQRSADRAASAKGHKIPDMLYKKFMTMFADYGKVAASVEKRNFLTSYILVLTLHADGFRTNVSDIVKDLGMSIATVREHYKSLGCKITSDRKLCFAMLFVPLEFPKPKFGRRKK